MELIAKKELLAETGISYGQLYRWKREKLIPEEWFIKRASSTGQETFFPRDQMLSRITAILDLKDTHSLEELAKIFRGEETEGVQVEDLLANGFFPVDCIEALFCNSESHSFSLAQLTLAHALWTFASTQGIPVETVTALFEKTQLSLSKVSVYESLCTVVSINGIYHVCLSPGIISPVFDRDVTVLGSVSLAEMVETVRRAITGGK